MSLQHLIPQHSPHRKLHCGKAEKGDRMVEKEAPHGTADFLLEEATDPVGPCMELASTGWGWVDLGARIYACPRR